MLDRGSRKRVNLQFHHWVWGPGAPGRETEVGRNIKEWCLPKVQQTQGLGKRNYQGLLLPLVPRPLSGTSSSSLTLQPISEPRLALRGLPLLGVLGKGSGPGGRRRLLRPLAELSTCCSLSAWSATAAPRWQGAHNPAGPSSSVESFSLPPGASPTAGR